jgi:hypothetical protein
MHRTVARRTVACCLGHGDRDGDRPIWACVAFVASGMHELLDEHAEDIISVLDWRRNDK